MSLQVSIAPSWKEVSSSVDIHQTTNRRNYKTLMTVNKSRMFSSIHFLLARAP